MNEQYSQRLESLLERNSLNFSDSERNKLRTLREMFLKLSDPGIPSHEIHYRDLIQVLYIREKMKGPDGAEFISLLTDVGNHLESIGYRQDILNLNEHMLRKSSLHGDNMDAMPYLVRGIVHSRLAPEEANHARQLEKYFVTYGEFFNVKQEKVMASLEPLDEHGNTIRNPRLVEIVGTEVRLLPTTYSKTFPFLRPERMNLDSVLQKVHTALERGQSRTPFTFALFRGPDGLGYLFAFAGNSFSDAFDHGRLIMEEMNIDSSKYLHVGEGRFTAESAPGKLPHFYVLRHEVLPVKLDEKLLTATLNQIQMLEPGYFSWSFSDPLP